jgi:hypothetical protein
MKSRPSGFAAAVSIARISAAVVRPFALARSRNPACTSSGTFRIIMFFKSTSD